MDTINAPHVVVVGGGFAGLSAAKALRKAPVRVTVVDRRNYHLFQPLLYQVATAALDPSDIAVPIRTLLHSKNMDVVLAEVTRIDAGGKRLILADGELAYDYLILATGAEDAYFGHGEWSKEAPGLKSIEDALEIRRRVFFAFEQAERESRPDARRAWLTFVLIGAGPTGVELAGALAEIAHHALKHDFHHINPQDAKIVLVEGHPNVLPTYPDGLRASARAQLGRLAVDVRTGARVTRIERGLVRMGEEHIDARTILWSAGVSASPLGQTLEAPRDGAGRVKVTQTLSVPRHEEIFVVGDLASIEQAGKAIPGIAPAAMQMGKHAALNVKRRVAGLEPLPFRFNDRGMFAVIGRGAAVGVAYGRVRMSGFFAWLAWLTIHLFFLIGFRNRLFVLAKWAYAYATMRRYARLITWAPNYGRPEK